MNHPKNVVLITGSSGLIGSALVDSLTESFDVVGLDRGGLPCPENAARCMSLDLTSEAEVQDTLKEVKAEFGDRIASVVHLAAYYDFAGADSPLYDKITFGGTERLLRLLNSFSVEQFIFSSTMLVHAPCQPGERINEESPVAPSWPYPISKDKTERLILQQHGNIPVVIFRIAGVYNDDCHSIPLANQIQRIYERTLTSHFYPGDPARGQAFIHLDDLCDALRLAIERRRHLPLESTFLLGEEETLSYAELQQTFERLIHSDEWVTHYIPKPLAKTGAWVQNLVGEPFIKPWMIDRADDHYALDISRARKELGWSPRHSLRDTLPKMVAALKADPHGWYKKNKLKDSGIKVEGLAGKT